MGAKGIAYQTPRPIGVLLFLWEEQPYHLSPTNKNQLVYRQQEAACAPHHPSVHQAVVMVPHVPDAIWYRGMPFWLLKKNRDCVLLHQLSKKKWLSFWSQMQTVQLLEYGLALIGSSDDSLCNYDGQGQN